MRTTLNAAATLTLGLALTVATATPAGAATTRATDPADTEHGSDLRRVVLKHGPLNVLVRTTHTDLDPHWSSGSSGTVFLDTDPADRGPEFAFTGGFFRGTDYQLVHTEGFAHRTWGEPVEGGSYRMRLDFDREQVRMRISRATLGNPAEIRVAVRSSGTREDGSSAGLLDWLGSPRSFTEWVAAG